MTFWERLKSFFVKSSTDETKTEVSEPSKEESLTPKQEILQMDVTFVCGVGMVVTGVNEDLMREVLSAYKQYCDAYGKKRITVSSLKDVPFAVTKNGPCEDLLAFFAPFSRENEMLVKLKEYGVDYFQVTTLEADPSKRCFFITYEKKAVERIVKELHIEPEYVNVTFWDSGLQEDKSQDDGLRVKDFGREVVLNTWFLDKYIQIGMMDEYGVALDKMTEAVPTKEQVLMSDSLSDEDRILKERAEILASWGENMRELMRMEPDELNALYEELSEEKMKESRQFVSELSEKVEDYLVEDIEERRVVD